MKRILFVILPCILAACTLGATGEEIPTVTVSPKLLQLTAQEETVTAGYPKNDATITAIMANKYASGTAAAASMTAIPSETLIPTIPPESPFCHPADMKTTFKSMGATQTIPLGSGLTNISNNPCFLQAWPQVILADQKGKPLEMKYTYFEMGPADAATAATEQAQESATAKVGVWPGWTAWLNLSWSNWCGAPVTGGAVIRLILGDQAGTIEIQTDIQEGGACNATGYRSTIGIAKFDPAMPPQ